MWSTNYEHFHQLLTDRRTDRLTDGLTNIFLWCTPAGRAMGSKFGKIGPGTYELAALERLEKSP